MYTLARKFKFKAIHCLHPFDDDTPISTENTLHGHSYLLTIVVVRQATNKNGQVVDRTFFEKFREYLDTHVADKNLEKVFTFHTTIENLTHFFHKTASDMFPNVLSVSLEQDETLQVTYTQKNSIF